MHPTTVWSTFISRQICSPLLDYLHCFCSLRCFPATATIIAFYLSSLSLVGYPLSHTTLPHSSPPKHFPLRCSVFSSRRHRSNTPKSPKYDEHLRLRLFPAVSAPPNNASQLSPSSLERPLKHRSATTPDATDNFASLPEKTRNKRLIPPPPFVAYQGFCPKSVRPRVHFCPTPVHLIRTLSNKNSLIHHTYLNSPLFSLAAATSLSTFNDSRFASTSARRRSSSLENASSSETLFASAALWASSSC